MIKYIVEEELIPTLAHLHALNGIRCIVLDCLGLLAPHPSRQREAIALTLNLPGIELVVITTSQNDLFVQIPFGVQGTIIGI
jgi:hypothetical protein